MEYIESEIVELKEKYTDAVVRDMVAFLNTNGGAIYIGITDLGEVKGLNGHEIDSAQKKISDCITSQIEPNPQTEIKVEVIDEGEEKILLIKVNKGYRSIYCLKKHGFSSKGCLVRIGSTCKEMSAPEIQFRYRNNLTDRDNILIAPAHYAPLTFDMMKILLISKGFHVNPATFESNFNLLTKDGGYNLMAELLADKNLVPIIFVKFRGRTKATMAQRSDYGDQSILLAYQRLKDRLIAENICLTNTSVRPRIDEYLYDIECVNEALVNAIVHNDWTVSEPLVCFYEDRLEITSYGGIPQEISEADFFNGVSCPRNSVLMRIFLKLGIVEHTGHGIPKIIGKYGREAFEIHDSFINVVIPFNRRVLSQIGLNDGQNIGENNGKNLPPEELSQNERSVLHKLIADPAVPYLDLVKDLQVSRRTISRVFSTLIEKGFIERVGTNKSGYWKVIR